MHDNNDMLTEKIRALCIKVKLLENRVDLNEQMLKLLDQTGFKIALLFLFAPVVAFVGVYIINRFFLSV